MKNLYEAATVATVKERVAHLRPDSQRLWGKMNVAQAVAHCSLGLEWAVGDSFPPRMFLGRIMGWIVKPMAPTARTAQADPQDDLNPTSPTNQPT